MDHLYNCLPFLPWSTETPVEQSCHPALHPRIWLNTVVRSGMQITQIFSFLGPCFQWWHIIVAEQQITFILLHPGRWTAQWELSEIISSSWSTKLHNHRSWSFTALLRFLRVTWWRSKINSLQLKNQSSIGPHQTEAFYRLTWPTERS